MFSQPFIVLDTETSGLNPKADKIIEVGILKIVDGKIVDRIDQLINPGVPIPREVQFVTGIKDEMVSCAPKLLDLAEQIKKFIGDLPICGHNVAFDLDFLRYGGVLLGNQSFDTLDLAQLALLKEPSYSLETLTQRLGIPHLNSHRAIGDCEVTLQLFNKLYEKLSSLPAKTIGEMCGPFAGLNSFYQVILQEAAADDVQPPLANKEEDRGQEYPSGIYQEDILEGNFILQDANLLWDQDIPLKLANGLADKTFVVYAGLPEHLQDRPNVIFEPWTYLCLRRHAEYQTGEMTEQKALFLARMAHWLSLSVAGNKKELNFMAPDWPVWKKVAIDLKQDCQREKCPYFQQCFFWRQIESLKKEKTIITSYSFFVRTIEENFIKDANVLITESHDIESILSAKLERTVNVESFREENRAAEMLFGYLGMALSRYQDNPNYNTTVLSGTLEADDQYQKVLGLAKEVNDQDVQEFFFNRDEENNLYWFVLTPEGEVALKISPKDVQAWWQQEAEKRAKKIILLTPFGTKFVSWPVKEVGLNAEKAKKIKLNIVPDGRIEEIVSNLTGDSLVVINNLTSLQEQFLSLNEKLSSEGILLLAQRFSGGRGKILHNLTENPSLRKVLFCTPSFLRGVPHYPFRHIILYKLPFGYPSTPVFEQREKQCRNSFKEFALPRVIGELQKLFYFLSFDGQQQSFWILDKRIESDYGQEIVEGVVRMVNSETVKQ